MNVDYYQYLISAVSVVGSSSEQNNSAWTSPGTPIWNIENWSSSQNSITIDWGNPENTTLGESPIQYSVGRQWVVGDSIYF